MGRGVARAASAAGAQVVVAGRRPIADRDPPGDLQHAIVDVTDEASVRALFDSVGAFDHLVVTAAPPPGSWGPLVAGDTAAFRRYLDDKLGGSLHAARWAVPQLRAGGSMTFLTGVAAVKPRTGMAIVSVAFAAVEALARALAVELAPLRVNAIRPGLVDSEMWNGLDPAARQALFARAASAFPVGRVGTPDDIGQAAVFLMTNRYVTGSILEVTGGEQLTDAF
jgi:NAD(P)-dependent dehydrogenase (short-subunit alcohol dehydrogenase family)